MIKTYIYVDGFNLYYGVLKRTPYKWLDLDALCRQILPANEIVKIKYFTARVKPRSNDQNAHLRQDAYLRALQTLGNVEIIFGTFLEHIVTMPSADNPRQMVRVIKTEEKGSDVNLATHLLFDGCQNAYELAVVLSNDSDLVEPVNIVRKQLKKRVGLLCRENSKGYEMRKAANFHKFITEEHLNASQFPSPMTDEKGRFYKPRSW